MVSYLRQFSIAQGWEGNLKKRLGRKFKTSVEVDASFGIGCVAYNLLPSLDPRHNMRVWYILLAGILMQVTDSSGRMRAR